MMHTGVPWQTPRLHGHLWCHAASRNPCSTTMRARRQSPTNPHACQAIFTEFEAEVASRAMRLTSHPAQPQPQDMGVKGREWDYEGGFRLMIIDRPGSPWAGAEQLRLES